MQLLCQNRRNKGGKKKDAGENRGRRRRKVNGTREGLEREVKEEGKGIVKGQEEWE
jgi:hypothetical protein